MKRRALFQGALKGIGLAGLGLAEARAGAASPQAPGKSSPPAGRAPGRSAGESYRRIKAYLDSVPAMDLHEHLRSFDQLVPILSPDKARGPSLNGIWGVSYLSRIARFTPRKPETPFEQWWGEAKKDFANFRTTGFYRYMWQAMRDLYGVDFDHITDAQAADVDRRIHQNYQSEHWLRQIVLEKANIECILCDRWWEPYNLHADYPFELLTLHTNELVSGFHPSVFQSPAQHSEVPREFVEPYAFAGKRGIPVNSLDDYLALLDHMFAEAKAADCVCLKCTLAYSRTLRFENVPKERAAVAFGRPRSELTPEQVKDFEDFIMWRVTEMSAKYELPYQIHTGDADLRYSNPTLLVNLIDANPKTKFELFHGGVPWTREFGAIGNKYPRNVWLNCTWLPTFGRQVAVDAFRQWLDLVPSNRLNWGGDDSDAEGIYGAAELNRQCWAEALAERVDRGDLDEPEAKRIGKQVLRDNALELYPRFREKLWKARPAAKG